MTGARMTAGTSPATHVDAEGRLMTVAGKCVYTSTSAVRGVDVRGVTFRDGEVRLDVRVMSAFERAQFVVQTRSVRGSNWHFATIRPGLGEVIFGKTVDREDTVFGHRTDLQDLLSPNGWNSVAVRSRGADHWLLINDLPVLFASDATFDAGGLTLSLRRLGDPDDDEEVAVVFKNLRVSALAVGDPGRAPSFTRP